MPRRIRMEIIVFAAVSVALHVALLSVLPGRFADKSDAAERTVTVAVSSARPAVPPERRVRPPKPQEPKPGAAKPAATTVVEKQQNKEQDRERKPDAPAPARLPSSAVVSTGFNAGPDAIAVPVGKDTGGTGFTDSKGTSLENRRIETGEAPARAPEPEPPRVATPPPEPKPDIDAVRSAYAKRVRDRIEAEKDYPSRARRGGVEGVVSVQFTIGHGGEAGAVSVAQTSGSKILDNAALDAVRNAAPFPPLPAELGKNEFTLRVSIVFRLDQN